MTPTVHGSLESPVRPRSGSLLRAELHRFRARRFIRVLVVLGVLGLLAGTAIAYPQFEKSSAVKTAEAERALRDQLAQDAQFREQCLRDFARDAPEGVTQDEFCPVVSEENYGGIDAFLDDPPFDVSSELPSGAVGVGVAAAALLFLIGSTYVGAEWSSRSMVALLFWEPRRLKVIATKALVALLGAAVIAVVAQALWVGAAFFLAANRGTTSMPDGFWGDLLADQGRLVALGVILAMLGFGATNLFRNTGATLGVGFVYLLVVENAVRGLRPAWQPHLLTTNAGALVAGEPQTISVFDERTQQTREIVIDSLRGGLFLTGVCVVVLVLGALLFKRRDLT